MEIPRIQPQLWGCSHEKSVPQKGDDPCDNALPLTGSVAAVAAQGVRHDVNLWESSCIAVELHASAADSLVSKGIGPIGLTPSETILEMRSLLNKLL